MSTDTTQYLSTTEFANRYNAMMPIDKDHMPLEPSFVELLCQKGEIEHSELPPGKGHKKYIYKIPEYELDRVAILINGDEFVEKPKAEPVSERPLLSTKEVAELLGITQSHVCGLAKKGKLVPVKKAERVHGIHGGKTPNMFDEDQILEYMEKHGVGRRKKCAKAKGPEKPTPVETTVTVGFPDGGKSPFDDIVERFEALEEEVKKLKESRQLISPSLSMASYADFAKAMDIIDERFRDLEEEVNERTSAKNEPVAEDILEAYRKGFKDGYEMGVSK